MSKRKVRSQFDGRYLGASSWLLMERFEMRRMHYSTHSQRQQKDDRPVLGFDTQAHATRLLWFALGAFFRFPFFELFKPFNR